MSAALHGCGTLGQIILGAIRRYAERPALYDGKTSWTYGELGDAVGRCIAVFRSLGIEKGAGIAMAAGNRAEQVAAQYAAVLMGLRFTALHLLSSREVHDFVLNDAGISLLIIDPALATAEAGDFRENVGTLRHVLCFGPSAHGNDMIVLMESAAPAPLVDEADADAVAYLFYTGGTTGQPKGVKLPHRSLVAPTLIQGCDWDLTEAEPRFLAATPTSHASGIILPTIFLRGGFVRLMQGFDAGKFCEVVERDRISCAFIVPTMLYALLDCPARLSFDLTSLHTIVYGAAPMSQARMRQALEEFGQIFVQLYGQTEAPMCITTLRKADHDPARPERLASAGLPCPSLQVRLFDPDMREVEDGEPGEICVRGPIVMDGYWNRDDATALVWRGGWHHTGDIAIRDGDGYIRIVDRTSDLIITGGYNVYPREVEDALLAHCAISSVAVVGVADEKWGEAVTAFVVLRPGIAVDAEALKAHVRELRGPVSTPKTIIFQDSLPVTPLGKIDRKALKAGIVVPA